MDLRNATAITIGSKPVSRIYIDNKKAWEAGVDLTSLRMDFENITKLTDNTGYIYFGPKKAKYDPSKMNLTFTTDIAPASGNNILINFDPSVVESVSDADYEGRIPFTFDPGLSSSGIEGIDRNAKFTLKASYDNNITTSKQVGVKPTWVMNKIWFSELEQFAEIDKDGNIKLQVSYSPIGGLLQAGGNEYGDFDLFIDNGYSPTYSETLDFIPGDIKIDSIYWDDHEWEWENDGVLRWQSYARIHPYGYDKLNPYPPVTKVEHTPNGTAMDITIDNVSITKLGFTKFDCDPFRRTSTPDELRERIVYFNPIKITSLTTGTRGAPVTRYQTFDFSFEGIDNFHDNYRLQYYDFDGYPKFNNRIEDQQYNAMPELYYNTSYQRDPHQMEIDVSKWYVDEINPNNEYHYDFSAIIPIQPLQGGRKLPMKFDFRSGYTDKDLKKEVRQ